jgi:hypothetical protein
MKESHDQGPAHPIDPESCVGVREDASEALTGAGRQGHAQSRLSRGAGSDTTGSLSG